MTSLPQAPFQNIIFLYVLAASPLQTPAQVRQAPELLGWKMVMVEQVCPPFLFHTILPYHNNTGASIQGCEPSQCWAVSEPWLQYSP
jgi:hypothetical protein